MSLASANRGQMPWTPHPNSHVWLHHCWSARCFAPVTRLQSGAEKYSSSQPELVDWITVEARFQSRCRSELVCPRHVPVRSKTRPTRLSRSCSLACDVSAKLRPRLVSRGSPSRTAYTSMTISDATARRREFGENWTSVTRRTRCRVFGHTTADSEEFTTVKLPLRCPTATILPSALALTAMPAYLRCMRFSSRLSMRSHSRTVPSIDVVYTCCSVGCASTPQISP
mmetsp:Transcript_30580/g.94472  ORF Transcript_30580/g.94472 Transcript_30580/m.94472 type:complete len:226 (-) Transcript_30580:66-743(-)